MRPLIVCVAVLCLSWPAHAADAPVKMETRRYPGVTQYVRQMLHAASGDGEFIPMSDGRFTPTNWADTVAADLKKYLGQLGVSFTNGAYVVADPLSEDVLIRNTQAEHAKIRPMLELHDCDSGQILFDSALVAFPRKDIEALARKSRTATPAQAEIQNLWQTGRGRLIASQKTVTRSGVNTQMTAADEIIFPAGGGTNPVPASVSESDQAELETREAGFIMNITPTLHPDGRTVDITMAPAYTTLAGTNSFDTIVETAGKSPATVHHRKERPVFRTGRVLTICALEDGATLVLGDLAVPSSPESIYLFMSVSMNEEHLRPSRKADQSILLDDAPAAP